MKSENLHFKNSKGIELSARTDFPDDKKCLATVLFAHCFTCSKNLKALGHISRALTEQGIGVFRFDFTGLGSSDGEFTDSTFSTDVKDIIAASDYMKENWIAPSILMGHSLGGAAILQSASGISSAKAVATIGSPCSPSHVEHLFEDNLQEIKKKGEARVILAGRPFTINAKFIEDLNQQVMDEKIAGLNKALLVFHSPVDETVGIDNASRIFKMARHPKSFVSLDKADHLLTKEEDARYVGSVTAAWAHRYFS